jgi:PKD repeat protein
VVYYGPSAGNYPSKIDVGSATTASVTNLTEGATYHFAVTAYDLSHAESGFSSDVSRTVPYAAPVARFTASAVSGLAPLALNFSNGSTGIISSYSWTFGDGTTSTLANPSKVYLSPGEYTVTLTVAGPGGSDLQTRTDYILVSPGAVLRTCPPGPKSRGRCTG